MNTSIAQRAFVLSAVVLAALSMAGGVLFFVGAAEVDFGGDAMTIGVAIVLEISGALVLMRLWRLRSARSWGSGTVAVCAVPLGICFWWTGFAPALSLLMVIVGIMKSRDRPNSRVDGKETLRWQS